MAVFDCFHLRMGSEGFHCSVCQASTSEKPTLRGSATYCVLPKHQQWVAKLHFAAPQLHEKYQRMWLNVRKPQTLLYSTPWSLRVNPSVFPRSWETQIWFLELRVIKADARWWLEPNVSSSLVAAAPWCMKTLCHRTDSMISVTMMN